MHISQRQIIALTVLRIVVGVTFCLHGAQKVFGVFGGPGLEGFVLWAVDYGLPAWLSYLAAFAEFVGGLMILLGIVPEIGILMTMSVMIGAIACIHGLQHYFVQDQGFEYPFILILLDCVLLIGGPGLATVWDPLIELRSR